MTTPDDNARWWSVTEVATYLGVQRSTVSAYLGREQMPKPDTYIGGKPGWSPATIKAWHQNRPGRGKRATR